MRNNKKMLLSIILLITIILTPNVYAAKTSATYSISMGNYSATSQWDCYEHPCRSTYSGHTFTVNYNGTSYPAYCIRPNLSARSYNGNATCRLASKKTYPLTYWLANNMVGADTETSDIAFRMAGIIDSEGDAGLSSAMGVTHRGDEGLALFITTYQTKIKGMTLSQPGLYGFVLQGSKVDAAMGYVKSAIAAVGSAGGDNAGNAQASGDGTGVVTGKYLTFTNRTKLSDTSVSYLVTNTSGQTLSDVKFTCSGGCSVSVQGTWSGAVGSSATIIVTAASKSKCSGVVTATFGNVTGGGKSVYVCTIGSNSQQAYVSVLPGATSEDYSVYMCDGDQCCDNDHIPPTPTTVDINNCCEPTGESVISEPLIGDLFCYDKELKIVHFVPKCGAENYKNENSINDYCEFYCTEDVKYKLPGASSAKSGRYFKLATFTGYSGSTITGPSLEGHKRCKLLIHYDQWELDYKATVEEEVKQYNTYQAYYALSKEWDNANGNTDTYSQKYTINCSVDSIDPVDVSKNLATGGTTMVRTCDGASGSNDSQDHTRNVTRYHVIGKYYYNQVQSNSDTAEYQTAHSLLKILASKSNPYPNVKASFNLQEYYLDTSEYQDAVNEANTLATQLGRAKGSISACGQTHYWSCSASIGNEFELAEPTAKSSEAMGTANSALGSYNAATSQAKSLETQLTTCDKYFETASASTIYNMDPSMDFSYSQVYLDDYGNMKNSGAIGVDFERKGCVAEVQSLYAADSSQGTDADQYSGIYLGGNFNTTDFKSGLTYDESRGSYTSHFDQLYEAKKVFTRDVVYHMICEWVDKANDLYTLVPSGAVVGYEVEMNYTRHERQYFTWITALEGQYETKFTLSGVGSDGKFDSYVNSGTTCSGSTGNATCKFNIYREVTKIGYCNQLVPIGSTESCKKNSLQYQFLDFKVVDTTDLFPSQTGTTAPVDTNGKSYAYNWFNTETGRQVLAEIQQRGANDQTYAPSNLTYSFKLTSNDMAKIKSYNSTRESSGGYGDFNLHCSCSDSAGGTCTKCKSYFLEAITSGSGESDKGTSSLNINIWNRDGTTLEQVRNSIFK